MMSLADGGAAKFAACDGRCGAGIACEFAEAKLKRPDGAASAAGCDDAEARLKPDDAGSIVPGRDFGIGTAAMIAAMASCSCCSFCCGATDAVTRRALERAATPASSSSSRTLRAAMTGALVFAFCTVGLLEATCVSGPFDMMRASCA